MPTNCNCNRGFVIAIENRPGTFAGVCDILGKRGVNVIGFSFGAHGKSGTLRFVTSDPQRTEAWLRTTHHAGRWNEVSSAAKRPRTGRARSAASRAAPHKAA